MTRIKKLALGALMALSLINGGLLIGTTIESQIRQAFSQESPTQAPLPAWTRRGRSAAPIGALPTLENRRKQEDPNKASG